jgi:hypothetical protein
VLNLAGDFKSLIWLAIFPFNPLLGHEGCNRWMLFVDERSTDQVLYSTRTITATQTLFHAVSKSFQGLNFLLHALGCSHFKTSMLLTGWISL